MLRFGIIVLFCLSLFINGCAGGVSNVQTATDNQLYHDLRLGSAWLPIGHHGEVKDELRRRHPEYSWHQIDRRQISEGMTKEEVIISWGFPGKVNKASYGEQWIYGIADAFGHRSYVYFKGNVCTGWQQY